MSRRTVALLALVAAMACATNPATGRSEFMLVSQDQEISMGREYDPQVVASIGLYPDTALQRYVQDLGARIAAQSERPGLPWTFRVLDDPTVNAFAIPGGFIYVTRGILAHLASEAQLAAVLGHEIGHVTARHSASQMSQQQLAQVGLALGSAMSERFAQYAELAGQGLGILFLKYSRDDESQADALGLRYMRRTKHDVREMPGVFTMLAAVSEAAGQAGKVPDWLSTHPAPADRFQRISRMIAEQPQDTVGVVVAKAAYTRRLDDVVYDLDPRAGYFTGVRFTHPTLRFTLTFPDGWATKNEASAVRGMSAENDAAIQLTVSKEATADAAMRAFAAQQGVQAGSAQRSTVNGLSTSGSPFAAASNADTLRGAVLFVEHNGMVFELVGYGAQAGWAARQPAVERALRSFAVLTDRAALNVQPQRLDIVTLDRRMSLGELISRRPSPRTIEELALINQVRQGEPLPAGTLVKWVVGPPLPH